MGISGGITTITYGTPTCYVTAVVTVIPMPAPIAGPGNVCTGNTITLTNSIGGGSWSSSNPGVASVGVTTGIVSGVSGGTTTITYAIASCYVTRIVTVIPMPTSIVGAGSVCSGSTLT